MNRASRGGRRARLDRAEAFGPFEAAARTSTARTTYGGLDAPAFCLVGREEAFPSLAMRAGAPRCLL